MKVLVTGANGLLATHTILQLLEQGYKVRGMLRDPGKMQLSARDGLELAQGDLRDKTAVERAVSGCGAVVHAAAAAAPDILTYDFYYQVNVIGTKHVLEAAKKNNVKKFVFVSTANTIGHGTAEKPGREGDTVKPPFSRSWYARSKTEAEKSVREAFDVLDVVIVHPTFMLGAWDAKPSSGRIIKMGLDKRLVLYPPGGKNFVNAADVAAGIIAAMEKGENKASYLLAGDDNLSYRTFFKRLKQFGNKNTLLIPIPKWLMLSAGYLGELLRLFNIQTGLSKNNTQILCTSNFYANQKAKSELGVHFRPIEMGIGEAIKWFKKNG